MGEHWPYGEAEIGDRENGADQYPDGCEIGSRSYEEHAAVDH